MSTPKKKPSTKKPKPTTTVFEGFHKEIKLPNGHIKIMIGEITITTNP